MYRMMNASKRVILLAISAIGLAHVTAGEVIYFLVGPKPGSHDTDSAVIPLSKPEHIEHARELIANGPNPNGEPNRSTAVVKVRAGKIGINRNYLDPKLPEWSWHVEEVYSFGDIVAEILMITPA